jgi:elongation factor P
LEVIGYFDEENLVSIELPIKIEYEVKNAPPGVKGDTAQGGSKVVICENGLEVVAPLFIKEGDKIIVNTETGEYVSKI